MTTNDDEVRAAYAVNADDVPAALEEWDAWLDAHDARVRRDAARGAIDGLIADKAHMTVLLHAETGGDVEGVLTNYRDTFHPEETP